MKFNLAKTLIIIFLSFFVLFSFDSCIVIKDGTKKKDLKVRQNVSEFAKKQIGTPYCFDGKTKKCFDEAGFTSFVFKKYDIGLATDIEAQVQSGKDVIRRKAQIGDLIFFKKDRWSKEVVSVGIIISASKSDLVFIHCSDTEGVTVNSLNQDYFKTRFMQIRTMVY